MGHPIENHLESANLENEQKEVLQHPENAADSTQPPKDILPHTPAAGNVTSKRGGNHSLLNAIRKGIISVKNKLNCSLIFLWRQRQKFK